MCWRGVNLVITSHRIPRVAATVGSGHCESAGEDISLGETVYIAPLTSKLREPKR
jgi:hypothetical protein